VTSNDLPIHSTIGIVVPAYKEFEYLMNLFESLLKQSDGRFEVLVIDDSAENLITKEILSTKLDERFSLLTNRTNLGPFTSWNSGISEMLSRKKYSLLSIVHEDDVLHEDYVKNSLLYFEKYPAYDIFHSKVKIIGSNGRRKYSFQDSVKSLANFGTFGKPIESLGDKGLERILRNNFVFCPAMVFNASKFRCIEFDTHWKMVGDLEFISQALLEGRSFLQLPDKNYFYRRHNNNLTAELTHTTKRFEEEIELYGELESRCREVGYHKSAAAAKKARMIKLHITYRLMISLLRCDFVGFRRLFNVLLTIGK
jgi:glycosyltransferase involved in cell wall biosynthesis